MHVNFPGRKKSFIDVVLFFVIVLAATFLLWWHLLLERKRESLRRVPIVLHRRLTNVSMEHCVLQHFLRPTKLQKRSEGREAISLVLHSTIDFATHLVDRATAWNGPVSYAVFVTPGTEWALPALRHFHACHDALNERVGVHLVWFKGSFQRSCNHPDLISLLHSSPFTVNCSSFDQKAALMELRLVRYPLGAYPINVMRNEARRGANTRLHLIADMETEFSPAFSEHVTPLAQKLLDGRLPRAVLVFRRFELHAHAKMPQNVKQLKRLYDNKKVRHFHANIYRLGHFIPNLEEWFRYSLTEKAIVTKDVSYGWKEWEPQFIMTDQDPYHLEFIPTRHYDHQTLCHELCRAGYRFLVLSHVFNVHRGLKTNLTALEALQSKLGLKRSRIVLRRFEQWLDTRYPDSRNRCPRFLEHEK